MDKKEYIAIIKQCVTMLYVEDESMVRDASIRSLKRRFKEVYTAIDGEEGLSLYNKYSPNIVLTDILMPRHNGLEMIKKIRETDRNIPIVVVTAHDESTYMSQAKEYSIHGYFVKPLNDEEFLEFLYNLSVNLIDNGQIDNHSLI
ncbi:MAG: response regulator [Nitrospirae bacterium]|nr:response regulator [Nitrospirota bacterium]